jgi:hypothetical protein
MLVRLVLYTVAFCMRAWVCVRVWAQVWHGTLVAIFLHVCMDAAMPCSVFVHACAGFERHGLHVGIVSFTRADKNGTTEPLARREYDEWWRLGCHSIEGLGAHARTRVRHGEDAVLGGAAGAHPGRGVLRTGRGETATLSAASCRMVMVAGAFSR